MVEEGPKSHQEINNFSGGIMNIRLFQQRFDAITMDEIFLQCFKEILSSKLDFQLFQDFIDGLRATISFRNSQGAWTSVNGATPAA